MAINMASSVVNFVLKLGISFLLTPFIVGKLGAAAYGFIGLSNNIVGYAALLTVALNSMSGRYIALKFHEGDIPEANRYYSSTFFANQATALFIIIVFGIITFFFDDLVNIPPDLVGDVKALFALTFINSALNLVMGIYGMGQFLKNRIELGNIRLMIAQILRAVLIVIAYALFPVHLWYLGLIAIICSCYSIGTNIIYNRALTPELKVRRSSFRIAYVIEMIREGAWNLLTSLSSVLNQGLDLLLANVFISAYYMGIMSLSKSIPWMILALFSTLANTMHPEFLKHYAQKRIDLLGHSLVKSIRVLGLFTAIPCACLLAYGDIFYALWLPKQDFIEIYHVSCITMAALLVTLPTQSVWYVFTMAKKVKTSSLNLIVYGIINVILVLIAVNILDDDRAKLYAIVIIQAILMVIRFTTFLPFYGAKVIGLPRYTLFWPLVKIVAATAFITGVSLIFKYFIITTPTWWGFAICVVFSAAIGLPFNYFLSLSPSDRAFVKERFLTRRKHNA